jgi:outer membrane lipoprotein SlyB
MRYFLALLALLLFGCTSSETRTQDNSTERKIETEKTVEHKKGVEAGQPVDVVVERTVQKDALTEREARLQATAANKIDLPTLPTEGIANLAINALTGNWTAVVAGLASLLAGLTVGRKKAEGQFAEVTEGVSNFVKANPEQGSKLETELSKAMSKSTKKTVRRIKP